MTLQDWLQSFESFNLASAIPAHERCLIMLARLHISKWCPVVAVAGTNGKGSTTYCLAGYAEAMGRQVGRFISPHLLQYNERIAINNANACDEDIVAAFEEIKAVQDDLYLGYFDYAFLAAMLLFKKAKVDFIVLEVGLGGRLDAVNSIDADCALITTIDLDHTEILGETREAIGFEKAGIYRPHKIAICGDVNPPSSIKAYAEKIGTMFVNCPVSVENLPEVSFPKQNAITALTALQELDRVGILKFDQQVFFKVIADLRIPGRMQKLWQDPEIIVDVAHNPESVSYLVDYLKQHPVRGKTIAIFSAFKDKNIGAMLKNCDGSFISWNVLELDHPRAAEKTVLKEMISECANIDGKIYLYESMESLMDAVLKTISIDDRVVVFGSFYIANLFLNWYNINKKSLEFIWV